MQAAYDTLLSRPVKTASKEIPAGLKTGTIANDGVDHPRIVTLGGDHTIVRVLQCYNSRIKLLIFPTQVLPILRSLFKIYGPISVIHFDSHVDTLSMHS